MSGMVMIRSAGGIELYSDGGFFVDATDFTITGFASKPIVLPHLSAIMCFCGTAEIGLLLRYHQQKHWTSFDHLVTVIRDSIATEAATLVNGVSSRQRANGVLFVGGYSEARERWESYLVTVKAARGEEPEVGPLVDDYWFLFAPEADEAALRRYGFDPQSLDLAPVDAGVRYMRAMRATVRPMDQAREDEEPDSASTLAGFIERVTITRDFAVSQILWRWPDEPGRLVNPDDEGEPTPAFLTLLQSADAAGKDGGVHEHVEIGSADPSNDATAGEAGEISNATEGA